MNRKIKESLKQIYKLLEGVEEDFDNESKEADIKQLALNKLVEILQYVEENCEDAPVIDTILELQEIIEQL